MLQHQRDGNQNTQVQWTPDLHFNVSGGHCRLSLGSYAYGNGSTLQEAADALVAHLLIAAKHFRSGSGITVTSEFMPIDFRWFEFLYELSEIAERGEDIRPRLFNASALALP